MLQALNLRTGPPLLGPGAPLPAGRPGVAGTSVLVPGGAVHARRGRRQRAAFARQRASGARRRRAGVSHRPGTGHQRRVAGSSSTTAAITSGAGGPNAAGRIGRTRRARPRRSSGTPTAPATRFGHVEDIPADEPVQHVTYFEAEAYAAWAGARLPTEIEWEKACAWDPHGERRRRFPWGASEPTEQLANLGGDALRPAPVGAYPAGASAYGAEQMLGDVWEWTIVTAAAVAGLHADDLRAVFAAVLRRGLQGAARRLVGGGAEHPAAELPQLGSPDPAADLLGRPPGLGRLMCRHLGWLGDRDRSRRWCSTAVWAAWCSRIRRDGRSTA